MRNSFGLVVLLALSINLTACGKKPDEAAVPNAAAAGGSLPAACTNYLDKYQSCLKAKVPASAQPMLEQSMTQTRTAWEKAAATAEGKAGLTMACEQAHAAAKTSMQAYGCEM
ncbi:MAG: hypothetical protein HYS18_07775 [Burkholderiales bacterium]|nr:hypothetical protein [Burkholderiales bacterium]